MSALAWIDAALCGARPQAMGALLRHFRDLDLALLQGLGRDDEARIAFDRALALAKSPAEAAHIRMQIDRLTTESR
jgi:predicted RNA polymerase sigma factor